MPTPRLSRTPGHRVEIAVYAGPEPKLTDTAVFSTTALRQAAVRPSPSADRRTAPDTAPRAR